MDLYIYAGDIQLFPYSFAPQSWLECYGQSVSIQQYQMLYALIGTKFGGDGKTTFKLPDLRDASPFPNLSRYCICTDGTYPQPS